MKTEPQVVQLGAEAAEPAQEPAQPVGAPVIPDSDENELIALADAAPVAALEPVPESADDDDMFADE